MADRMDIDQLRNQVDLLREQLSDLTDEAGHEARRYRARAVRGMRGVYGERATTLTMRAMKWVARWGGIPSPA